MDDKTIPSINNFLDKIDPEKTIDRDIAMMQIGAVVLGKSVEKIREDLDENQNKEIDQILSTQDQDVPTKVFEFLKRINKFDEFTKVLDEMTNEIRNDYIKTHLETLTEDERNSLSIEYPALKMLLEE